MIILFVIIAYTEGSGNFKLSVAFIIPITNKRFKSKTFSVYPNNYIYPNNI